MIVSFTRLSPDGLHSIRVERDDGVVLTNGGSRNRAGFIPHDMGHLVADQAFGLRDGFWGSLAEGALFQSQKVLEGKLRHDARAKSAQILRRNKRGLLLSEVLAGPPYDAVVHSWDIETAYKALVRAWGHVHEGNPPYDRAALADAIEAFRRAREDWEATPVGEAMRFDWQVARPRHR